MYCLRDEKQFRKKVQRSLTDIMGTNAFRKSIRSFTQFLNFIYPKIGLAIILISYR